MPVDNEIYDSPGDIWWDEEQVLSALRVALNPARFPYFLEVLTQREGIGLSGSRALDIGCGGGILAEEFARLGCTVTGIDPSGPSLGTARAHAAQGGLDITYVHACGEQLPFPDLSFDIAYCCDVLEHVDDLDRVVSETARVLKPGGVYLFDTLNRTLRSKVVTIKLLQEWPHTRILPAGLHDWAMFIKPTELNALMAKNGLEGREVAGMKPAANPLRLLRCFTAYRRGLISFGALAQCAAFTRSRDTSISYMGYAVKENSAGDQDPSYDSLGRPPWPGTGGAPAKP